MNIYKHIVYNPQQRDIESVIEEAQDDTNQWQFIHSQSITEYEWVVVFEKEVWGNEKVEEKS